MNLKPILIAVAATALLAGCATGYQYRGGAGDYYYGSPSVEYRIHGSYGYPYGYGGYGGYGYGGGYGYYGYPYYYGGGYYYPWYRHRHGHHGGGHDHDDGSDNGDDGGDTGQAPPQRPTPPWRDLGSLGGRGKLPPPPEQREASSPRTRAIPQRPVPQRPISRPAPRMSAPSLPSPRLGGGDGDGRGSRVSEMLRRSQQ